MLNTAFQILIFLALDKALDMPFARTQDGLRLHYEEAGTGEALVFVHEFGGDHRSWEPQMRFFSRRYQCVTFAARGFPPSDVPDSIDSYSQQAAVDDIVAVMDHLSLRRAHVVGLSMGGFAVLHFGLQHPDRARSICAGGVGYGVERQYEEYFRNVSLDVATQFEKQGSREFAKTYALGASRVQFHNKDPRGWSEFAGILAEHSAKGAANTMRGLQARRPNLLDLKDQFAKMKVPTLICCGDEDDHTLQAGIYLKKTIPACGLLVVPKTGHTLNLEEPEFFNRSLAEFLAMVETDKWTERDPRANPQQIMRTK